MPALQREQRHEQHHREKSTIMQIGMIGLGRMGGNMAKRLRDGGHEVVGFDMNPESERDVDSLEALVEALSAPRVVWVMVPSGKPTEETIDSLKTLLEPGDIVIDGGNAKYTEDRAHAAALAERGIRFLDCGVSGGVWGADRGYALMLGGDRETFDAVRPLLETLKPEGDHGLVLAGPVGGGHFAKMVHNGIEYGMMQAFGEGFATMMRSEYVENPAAVMDSWREGSVVASWLLDLFDNATQDDPELKNTPAVANESGEAKWMIEAALELGVPTPTTAAALWQRQSSRGGADDILRVVTALRAQFGGHVTKVDEIAKW
ncbi:phosphogluconate dehydrogenase (NAD(+)-dependent, decarboxylating) [Bifidobacterium margollesii]|nr:decarboxylating 6-phosphogluconate dehydrogenase [Bifidobacterium margollesii]